MFVQNSLKGAVYDLKNWDRLPGGSEVDKLKFVMLRDRRGPFLGATGVCLVFFLLLFTMLMILIVGK